MGVRNFLVSAKIRDDEMESTISVTLEDTATGQKITKTRTLGWLGRRFFDREMDSWKKIDTVTFVGKPADPRY